MRAVELNDIAIDMNKKAFNLGRLAAENPEQLMQAKAPAQETSVDDIIATRSARLKDYQNEALALRYQALVSKVRSEEEALGGDGSLTLAVATYYFKLLAHKDEWEVARLYSRPEFKQQLQATFDGNLKLKFHIGGWPFGRVDPATGKPVKRGVGQWLMGSFHIMAALRGLRGSVLDPFRYSAETKLAQSLLQTYELDIAAILNCLHTSNHVAAVSIARLPEHIRGYGHVLQQHATDAQEERSKLLAQLHNEQAEGQIDIVQLS